NKAFSRVATNLFTILLLSVSLVVAAPAYAELLYVSSVSGTVGAYTTSGEPVNASLISGLPNPGPWGIAVAGSSLFVANYYSRPIGEYTTSGAVVNSALISGLSGPYGIAVSGSNLFITNSGSGTVAEYATSGALVNPALISGLSDTSGGPLGIAV